MIFAMSVRGNTGHSEAQAHKPFVRNSREPNPWASPISFPNETIPRRATWVAYPSNGIACVCCASFFMQFWSKMPMPWTFAVSHDQQYSAVKTCCAVVADDELEIRSFSPDSVAYGLLRYRMWQRPPCGPAHPWSFRGWERFAARFGGCPCRVRS